MSTPRLTVTVAPVSVPKPVAAQVLGMSVDSFDRYVMAEVRCVRRGSLRLFPVAELDRWANENAQRLLDGAK
jgi:hypothetical protein